MHYSVIIPDEGYQDLNPVQFGYAQCPPSHFYGPAVRTHWLMHFVVSGHGKFKIGEKEYALGENDIFVIPPYAETYYEADTSEPWSYIWIGFTAGNKPELNLPDVLHAPELRSLFISMKACESHEHTRSAFLCAKLWELYASLEKRQNYTADYIDTALAYIHAEYAHPLTVESIADHLKLERTYFSALFKKRTGVAPKQYLLNYRMEIAARLLTKNQNSVSVAAASVGYTDVFNFSKMFKRHFGLSPSEYAKKNR